MLAQNTINTKSGFKVIQSHVFGVSGKAVRQLVIIMLGLIVKVSTFDDIVVKKDLHIFPLDFKYSPIHSLKLRFPPVTRSDLHCVSKNAPTLKRYS